jgi:protocatechuate 3,4-dioxygenase, alpha subunit
MAHPTSQQTIGPFWHGLAEPGMQDLTRFGAAGRRVVLSGRVTDGDGAPVTDACIEIFQASPPASDRFPGWGRCATDGEGRFRFVTLAPLWSEPPLSGKDAPHLAVMIHARGLLKPLFTRCYFDGDPHNDQDPLLRALAPDRRATLVADRRGEDDWHLDLALQGDRETVFLEIGDAAAPSS